MAKNSRISWTDHTFNPWVGCQKVSPGCKHCYAEAQMTRKVYWGNTWGPPALTRRVRTSDENWMKPKRWNREAKRLGIHYKVFCASLADVFEDNDSVDAWRSELFALMDVTPYLAWQVLTKRPENVLGMIPSSWVNLWPENVWIGTSVENQEMAEARVPLLCEVPARIRFLSVEPMLGPVKLDLDNWDIAQVIIGGESGPDHRPLEIDWLESLVNQCQGAGVPVFVKQDSGLRPGNQGRILDRLWIREFPSYTGPAADGGGGQMELL